MKPLRALVLFLSMVALSAALTAAAHAQRVEGSVLDAMSGAPVPSALLRLRSLAGDTVWSTVSDASGRFVLRAPNAGSFMIEAQSLGYAGATLGPIRLEESVATAVEVRLSSGAVRLDSLRVVAQPRNANLERAGFYSRKLSGIGVFMDRSDIEKRADLGMRSLFSGRAGIRIMRTSNGRPVIVVRGGMGASLRAGSYCPARILVNGLDAYDFDFEMDLSIDALEGVEVYPGSASIPAEFGGPRSMCGVVAFWLRSGR